jgi:transcriptional regulator with XRE-family HTH domain
MLATLKQVSGKSIERARRSRNLTQAAFARDVGISARWLREVEAGNPGSTLDDHLRCARRLEIPLGQLLFPLLYLSRGMTYPMPLAGMDTLDIEER